MHAKKKPTTQRKGTDNFRSGYEKKVAKNLKDRNVPFEFEKEKIKYTVPASDHNYICDFKVGNIYVEAKGHFDRLARAKMIHVIEQNPDKDIRLLFQRNNKVRKNAKTTYVDWCTKRGIKCAVSEHGVIPEEWLREAEVTTI